nr:transposase [Niabella hibiscisoli]
MKNKGHYIVGYVIMPNHIHVLIAFRNTIQSINTIVGNGKRFMAYGIVKRLKAMSEETLLRKLEWNVNMSDRQRNKLHEVGKVLLTGKSAELTHSCGRNSIIPTLTPAKGNGCWPMIL